MSSSLCKSKHNWTSTIDSENNQGASFLKKNITKYLMIFKNMYNDLSAKNMDIT